MLEADPEVSYERMDHEDAKADWLVSSGETAEREERQRNNREVFRFIYRTYRNNFWAFYKLSVPPAIFCLLVNTGRMMLVRSLFRDVVRCGPIPPRVLFASGAVTLTALFLVWLLQCFAFAAVSATVMGVSRDESRLNSDGYARARERSGPVAYVAFVTYVRCIALFAISMYVILPAAYRVMPKSLTSNSWFWYAEGIVIVLLIAAAIMGYAFAIPLVVATDATGHEAMKRSWRLSDGHEGSLFRLIFESSFAGLIAAFGANWMMFFLLQQVDLHGFAGWATAICITLVSAAAELPMFIGFALLYEGAVKEKNAATTSA